MPLWIDLSEAFDVSVADVKIFVCMLAISFAFGIGAGLVFQLHRRLSPVERMARRHFGGA